MCTWPVEQHCVKRGWLPLPKGGVLHTTEGKSAGHSLTKRFGLFELTRKVGFPAQTAMVKIEDVDDARGGCVQSTVRRRRKAPSYRSICTPASARGGWHSVASHLPGHLSTSQFGPCTGVLATPMLGCHIGEYKSVTLKDLRALVRGSAVWQSIFVPVQRARSLRLCGGVGQTPVGACKILAADLSISVCYGGCVGSDRMEGRRNHIHLLFTLILTWNVRRSYG